ncbi:MAG: polysaccharide biosynthesis protein, partial [Gordonia sp. (in: high G+C Gram-positive bacteria)]
AGTAGTLVAAVLVAAVAAPPTRWLSERSESTQNHSARTLDAVAGVLRASGVQLVVIVAVSVDLVLARSVLDAHSAGLYSLGAVATKAAFWLPQAIGVVVYPRLADPVGSPGTLRRAVQVLAATGAVGTLAAALAGPLIPTVVSQDYRGVAGLMWLFALTGSMLAILQLMLLAAIARSSTRGAMPAALVVVGEVIAIVFCAHSVLSLAVIASVAATASVAVTALWLRLSRPRRAAGAAAG